MINLPPPTLDPKTVFSLCISRVRDPALKKRLAKIETEVVQASADFALRAAATQLHLFPARPVIKGVTTDELNAVYTGRMAKKKAPGRGVYDQLFASSPNDRCPLCAQRQVATLDHHLPKAHFPVLSVTPINLVPACGDCNKAKLNKLPSASSEETLHPYFDDLGTDRWLFAEVVVSTPAAVKFRVEVPPKWDMLLGQRVTNHFRCFGLSTLYAAQAADELLNIRHQMHLLHDRGGMKAVRDELEQRAESAKKTQVNSWRSATFDAFVSSDWFCNGGFA